MNIDLIEELTDTKEFSQICEDAEKGSRKSALFINKLMNELNILHFHLRNESHDQKVEHQISRIAEILVDHPSLSKSIHLEQGNCRVFKS